ncbi:MAG: UDP-N-acetylmuramoyl-tripeptide--D-alanyl-D-alanine ligase, partial [Gammaproteobacteria bacterium]|nr:UDP-N-acetylmuramoyl-tripeptide--D-alanyl-D-alanine ligase [Gammaproteobacteria bacterium]
MSMARLSWVAETAGGTLVGQDAGFDSVSTDSRSLSAGQLFVALRGPRHDANAFLPVAVERGAAGALVEGRQAVDLPQVEVADSGLALRQIGAAWRRRFAVPVIAVTGSNGKTTVKEMLGAIMRAEVREPAEDGGVLVTWGNLN